MLYSADESVLASIVAPIRPDGYERHRPEDTVLYQTVATHWPEFKSRMAEQGGLPGFVVREFEHYWDCGFLEQGCLRLECRHCGHSELVAFSCKGRAFCPSCIGRRMCDLGVHLEREVLPEVPIRHWICSLPWGLRALLGYDSELCGEVLGAFVHEVSRSLKWRAKKAHGLSSMAEAQTGCVGAIQRVDSALRLNVHYHILALDGVYVADAQSLRFLPLPTPTRAEVADIARRTADRIERILGARGRSLDPEQRDEEPVKLQLEHPVLAACYDAAARGIAISGDRAGQPTLRLITSPDGNSVTDSAADEPVAEVCGINVYAKQVVDGANRWQVERLCRYITRPPVAQDRLTRRSDGMLELAFKHPWKDGSRALILSPDDLLVRLCAAVPPPRAHQVRYFGVLSSHASLRPEVVSSRSQDDGADRPPPAWGDQLELSLDEAGRGSEHGKRHRWAWLLAHVHLADVEHCPKCQGPMRWVEVAKTPSAAARLMVRMGMVPEPMPRQPHPPLEQLGLPFDS